jgi:hypothetical protein
MSKIKKVKKKVCFEGYAVVPAGDYRLCYTNAPPIARHEGLIWQIYTNEKDAEDWCKIKFSDSLYDVMRVQIIGEINGG